MVGFILPANSATGGYEIDNSVRFNQGDHCLTQNFSGTESSNRKKWTFSVWFKRSNLISSAALFTAGASGQDEMTIRLEGHKIDWQEFKVSNSTMIGQLITNQLLRDVSAWYHLVCRWDSTDSTAGDRMKMFLNGSEITSFATDNNPTEDYDSMASNSVLHNVGRQSWNNAGDFDGYMAEINFVEGTALDASYFGETNDNGVWVPKKPDVSSYGNNGFFLEFQQTGTSQNSSGIGADTSGNDNHFAVSNLAAIDVTTDTPTNNFATWNSIAKNPNLPLAEGNTYAENTGTDSFRSALGTIGVSSGKWYWEFRGGPTGDAQKFIVGWTKADVDYNARIFADSNPTVASDGYGYRSDGNKVNNNSASSYGASWNSNTTVGIKLDLDNGTIGFLHGSDQGNAYTGLTTGIFYLPFCALAQASNGEDATSYVNFGNGAHSDFGTNTDANGYGGFAYSVPSGYHALNTKNLAEYG